MRRALRRFVRQIRVNLGLPVTPLDVLAPDWDRLEEILARLDRGEGIGPPA